MYWCVRANAAENATPFDAVTATAIRGSKRGLFPSSDTTRSPSVAERRPVSARECSRKADETTDRALADSSCGEKSASDDVGLDTTYPALNCSIDAPSVVWVRPPSQDRLLVAALCTKRLASWNAWLELDSQSAPTVVPDCHTRKSIERLSVSRRQVSPRASLLQLSRLSLGRAADTAVLLPP